MSRAPRQSRADLLGDLGRELRQLTGLGASLFRAAAARSGMTATDAQVVDMLEGAGPLTAGQLADLTGLTTGAITGMLNRLEEAGLVRRERDPEDGRRVIVRLAADGDGRRQRDSVAGTLGKAWDDLAASYDDAELAVLVEFLKRSNAIARQELVRLREAPAEADGGSFSAPLGDLTSAHLTFPSGITRLTLRADRGMSELYRARFEGTVPDVKANDGVVTIRYPRRLWMLAGRQGSAEVTLSGTVPWRIAIQGGASDVTAELGDLDLAGLEMKGGLSMIRLELPAPSRVVPIRMSGGASMITVRRPAGVPARVHLKGWASTLDFDDQHFSYLGNDVRLQSPGYDGTAPGYEIELATSVSTVSITAE